MNRAWSFLIGVATIGCAAQPEPVLSMFRGGPGHSGVATAAPAMIGGIRWRFETRGPVRSSPVIVGSELFVGSGDGNLYALDLETGTERWRFEAGESVASTPLVTGSGVAVTTLAGSIARVDRQSGRLVWRVRTGSPAPLAWGYEGTDYYSSSPVLVGEVLVAGSVDGSIYGIDWARGTVRWSVRTGGRVRASPAAADSTVFIGSFDGNIYALDARTGEQRWTFATIGATLVSANFGYDRRSIQSSPMVAGDVVFIGARDGHLYALDRQTGRERWKYAHEETSWIIASPAVRDSLVVDASSDAHFVHALRVRDGSEVWRLKTLHSIWGSPVIAGDAVFVPEGAYDGSGRGLIRALDLATGTERSRYVLAGPVLSTPAVAAGMLVAGSDDGNVYALGLGSALQRAVFWDTTAVHHGLGRTGPLIHDHFRGRGYAVVDANQLAEWMTARIADRSRSVVVFAIDHAPRQVAANSADTTLFRRYLEAGGKIVWTGLPPRMWVPNSAGQYSLTTFGLGGTAELLGVNVWVEPWDRYGALPSEAGRQWGLSGPWSTAWSSEVVSGTLVLARDERGYAAAWVKGYGGEPGAGFVQVGRPEWDEPALRQLAIVAEYFPASRSAR